MDTEHAEYDKRIQQMVSDAVPHMRNDVVNPLFQPNFSAEIPSLFGLVLTPLYPLVHSKQAFSRFQALYSKPLCPWVPFDIKTRPIPFLVVLYLT